MGLERGQGLGGCWGQDLKELGVWEGVWVQEVGVWNGSRRGWVFFSVGISTYKQGKFIDKILHHCCGNSFSFLKWSGRGVRGSVQGGILDNGL